MRTVSPIKNSRVLVIRSFICEIILFVINYKINVFLKVNDLKQIVNKSMYR